VRAEGGQVSQQSSEQYGKDAVCVLGRGWCFVKLNVNETHELSGICPVGLSGKTDSLNDYLLLNHGDMHYTTFSDRKGTKPHTWDVIRYSPSTRSLSIIHHSISYTGFYSWFLPLQTVLQQTKKKKSKNGALSSDKWARMPNGRTVHPVLRTPECSGRLGLFGYLCGVKDESSTRITHREH